MSWAGARVGIGTRFRYDGQTVEVIELAATASGNEVVLKDGRGKLLRVALKELMLSERARVIPDAPGPGGDDDRDPAGVVLGQLSTEQREAVRDRAGHVREVLTGYRSGSAELRAEGEPRPAYLPDRPLYERYAGKATELGVTRRTIQRWVRDYQRDGEAGLAGEGLPKPVETKVDHRWVETALEVMVEHTGESKPSRTVVNRAFRRRLELSHPRQRGPGPRPSPAHPDRSDPPARTRPRSAPARTRRTWPSHGAHPLRRADRRRLPAIPECDKAAMTGRPCPSRQVVLWIRPMTPTSPTRELISLVNIGLFP